MKWFSDPKPWPIHAFAFWMLVFATFDLLVALGNLERAQDFLELFVPIFDWTRDWTIVLYSAVYSIVLIPVIAIWGFASRVARLLLTAMCLYSVMDLCAQIIVFWETGFLDTLWVLEPLRKPA